MVYSVLAPIAFVNMAGKQPTLQIQSEPTIAIRIGAADAMTMATKEVVSALTRWTMAENGCYQDVC